MTHRAKGVTRLGTYMRSAAALLRSRTPTTIDEIRKVHGPWFSNNNAYPLATMERLKERGIATEVEGGWVRGPRWDDAAWYYSWPKESKMKEWTVTIEQPTTYDFIVEAETAEEAKDKAYERFRSGEADDEHLLDSEIVACEERKT
jgi:hypothetical protein